jgi:hypothetical protein
LFSNTQESLNMEIEYYTSLISDWWFLTNFFEKKIESKETEIKNKLCWDSNEFIFFK